MRLSLGWDRATCAKNFHVSERTLHNWETGKNDIPYTAYRLLRLLNGMELPGESWAGWYFAGGTLYTPEGYPLTGKDGSWWSLLVRQAATGRKLLARGAEGRAEGAPPCGGASARAAVPGPDALASGRREALAPVPLTAWPSSPRLQQPAQALNVSAIPHGNHGDNNRGVEPPCGQSDGRMPPLWQQPSDYPPSWNAMPAPDASGSGSASTPWFALHWTHTFVVLRQQGAASLESNPSPSSAQRLLNPAASAVTTAWQNPPARPPLPPQLPRWLPQRPSSPASSAAPSLVVKGDSGYGAVPHVLVPPRSMPPAEGVTPPARLRHLLPPVPPAPAVSGQSRPGNGPPRGTRLMPVEGYPRPDKQRGDYVNNSYETIISGWGR